MRLSSPMLVSAGDRIGFTSLSSSFPIAYTEATSGGSVLYRHLEANQTMRPTLGNSYLINQTMLNYTFSFVVFVNTGKEKSQLLPFVEIKLLIFDKVITSPCRMDFFGSF